MSTDNLKTTFLRLRPDNVIEKLPVDGHFWPNIMSGKLGTFQHEYLVTCHGYDSDWTNWERHPNGDEIVLLISGQITFILGLDAGEQQVELKNPGDFAFIPKGIWHTARTNQTTSMLFITSGEGTEHKQG